MRFMLLVYAGETDEGPTLELVEAMRRYNEELAKAGALLALDGLHAPATATRLRFAPGGDRPTVTDGPFTESKEFVGGYWIIQARSQGRRSSSPVASPSTTGRRQLERIQPLTRARIDHDWLERAP